MIGHRDDAACHDAWMPRNSSPALRAARFFCRLLPVCLYTVRLASRSRPCHRYVLPCFGTASLCARLSLCPSTELPLSTVM